MYSPPRPSLLKQRGELFCFQIYFSQKAGARLLWRYTTPKKIPTEQNRGLNLSTVMILKCLPSGSFDSINFSPLRLFSYYLGRLSFFKKSSKRGSLCRLLPQSMMVTQGSQMCRGSYASHLKASSLFSSAEYSIT